VSGKWWQVTNRSLLTTHQQSTHDVAVAYQLAMLVARVRSPLGALRKLLRRGQTVRRLPVKQTSAGSIPAAAAYYGRASQWAMAAVSKAAEQRCLEGSTPSPSALRSSCVLGQAARPQSSKLERWVRLPQDTSRSERRGTRGENTINGVFLAPRPLFSGIG
jgi:hypothetical protein